MDNAQFPQRRSRRPRYIDFVPVSRPQNPTSAEHKPLQIKVTAAKTSTTPAGSTIQTISEYTETATILYPPVRPAKAASQPRSPRPPQPEEDLAIAVDESVELGIIEDLPRPSQSHPATKSTSSAPPAQSPAAPDANRYTLGGKSPFINTTQVDKRPLSSHVPENSSHNLNSSKNVYSRHTVLKDDDQKPAPTIVKSKKKDHSGIGLVIAIILTLIVGGFVGAVAYLAFFQ